MSTPGWNHNVHYHRVVFASAPADCARALDIGCGDGVLTRELRSISKHVVGIDLHAPCIERARAESRDGTEYIVGDFFEHPFEPASFDLVASIAVLHHVDAERGLRRMANLVRPGGVLVVIGLAHSRTPRDFLYDLAGAVATRVHKQILGKHYVEHDAPKLWPPPVSYAEMRRLALDLLPGVRYRRHAMWRYSLVWRRPALSSDPS